MSIYNEWQNKLNQQQQSGGEDEFFSSYLEKETEAYKLIMSDHETILEGTVLELSEKFGMDKVTFLGFMDGINTSLKEKLDLEKLEEDTKVSLDIDYNKLYYNMLEAKAEWLFNLPEWENILTSKQRGEIKKQFNEDHRAVSNKVGRNDPCPCGSGKKYKKCCGK